MSVASEAIVGNIKALVAEGYDITISQDSDIDFNNNIFLVYVVTVLKDGEFVAEGYSGILSEAMADAYSQTPEVVG